MQDTNIKILERLSSRKFLIALVSVVSATLLCWFGKIDDGIYSTVLVATIGAYLTANVLQKNTTTS